MSRKTISAAEFRAMRGRLAAGAARGGSFESRLTAEDRIQRDVCAELDKMGLLYCAIPNSGKRGKYEGWRMKITGLKAGAPDIVIFEPRGTYHGLALELKSPGGRPTPEQLNWQERLTERGYKSLILSRKRTESIEDVIRLALDEIMCYIAIENRMI